MRIETTILGNLLINEEYTRKVLPFLKNDYFTSNAEKIVYGTVNDFVIKYNSLPTKEALSIELQEVKINEEEFKETMELLDEISKDTEEYTRKVLPFLKNDYFRSNAEKTIHETIGDFVTKYNALPTKEALSIELQEVKINEEEFKETMELLDDI